MMKVVRALTIRGRRPRTTPGAASGGLAPAP